MARGYNPGANVPGLPGTIADNLLQEYHEVVEPSEYTLETQLSSGLERIKTYETKIYELMEDMVKHKKKAAEYLTQRLPALARAEMAFFNSKQLVITKYAATITNLVTSGFKIDEAKMNLEGARALQEFDYVARHLAHKVDDEKLADTITKLKEHFETTSGTSGEFSTTYMSQDAEQAMVSLDDDILRLEAEMDMDSELQRDLARLDALSVPGSAVPESSRGRSSSRTRGIASSSNANGNNRKPPPPSPPTSPSGSAVDNSSAVSPAPAFIYRPPPNQILGIIPHK